MLYRPLIALMAASAVSVLLLCFVMMATASRSQARFEAASRHLEILTRLEAAARFVVDAAALGEERAHLEAALQKLQASRDQVDKSTAAALEFAFSPESGRQQAMAERRSQALSELAREGRVEWWLALILSVVLAIGTLLLFWEFRRHVLVPLETLNGLMLTMTRRRYETADATDITPSLRPLFESYNHLVERVSHSEEAQARREAALRKELRGATRALMQQQLAITRSQRMAATGELAAQIAHDVRNPLAGILTALENLRRELDDEEARERLQMVGDEVKRLARQLTGLVDAVRQKPEEARPIELADTVSSLLSLTGYQVPSSIKLEHAIPDGLLVTVPEGGLRQALLNLILNAAKAVGDGDGVIRVEAFLDASHLTLTVSDTGPGFNEKALRVGLRAFATLSTDGTGLGLAAARRFATDLGGDLNITNRDEGGARVILRLPAELCNG